MIAFFLILLFIIFEIISNAIFFPLPVNDTGVVRYRTLPWMTIGLIVINSLVFMAWQAPEYYQAAETATTEYELLAQAYPYIEKIWIYGFRGEVIRSGLSIGAFTTFTSMFMHADFWHLLYNMIYLWAFGRRVEDACGHWRFLLFYLSAGMVANLGSELLNPSMLDRPSIGASGAISGVMGAYLLLFPGAKVTCAWLLGSVLRVFIVGFGKLFGVKSMRQSPLWRWLVDVPSWVLLVFYAISNIIPSFEIIGQSEDLSGVNYLAHLAGFLGAIVIFLFVRKDLMMRYLAGRSL
jgi:membrane associated rhomboid family serine protease